MTVHVWIMIICAGLFLWFGSLLVAWNAGRNSQIGTYVAPDPLGCKDCGTVGEELNMWHRCDPCHQLLILTHRNHPEAVDLIPGRPARMRSVT